MTMGGAMERWRHMARRDPIGMGVGIGPARDSQGGRDVEIDVMFLGRETVVRGPIKLGVAPRL
jgi:hypothetical protein